MRPDFRYCAAVAWAKVLVWASLNCLHMVALASSSGGATSQPTRRPGDSTLLRLPQCASHSREAGTSLLKASNEGGGGSLVKYRSPYGSSSTISVWYFTASSSTRLRRSSDSSAPLGLPKVGIRYTNLGLCCAISCSSLSTCTPCASMG